MDFPAPDGTDQRGHRPRLEGEVDGVEHRRLGPDGVGEGDPVELDPAGHRVESRAAAAVDHGLAVEKLEDPLGGAAGAGEVGPQIGQRRERHGDDEGVEDERRELADGELAGHDHPAAEPQDRRHRAEGGHGHDADEDRHEPDPPPRDLEGLPDPLGVALGLGLLAGEAADGADPGDDLLGRFVGAGEGVLRLAGDLGHLAADHHRAHRHRRHQGQHEQGQPRRRGHQQRESAHQHHHVAKPHGEVDADGVLHHGGVARQPAGELAGLAEIEKPDLLLDDGAEDRLAEPRDDALSRHREEVVAEGHRDPLDREDRRHGDDGVVERLLSSGHRGVDENADHLRPCEPRGAAEDEKDRRRRQPPPLGLGQCDQPAKGYFGRCVAIRLASDFREMSHHRTLHHQLLLNAPVEPPPKNSSSTPYGRDRTMADAIPGRVLADPAGPSGRRPPPAAAVPVRVEDSLHVGGTHPDVAWTITGRRPRGGKLRPHGGVEDPKEPVDRNREIVDRLGLDYPVLYDDGRETIDAYGLVHAGASIEGGDIARPATLVIGRDGRVAWRSLTENWRVRVRPDAVIAALDDLD